MALESFDGRYPKDHPQLHVVKSSELCLTTWTTQRLLAKHIDV